MKNLNELIRKNDGFTRETIHRIASVTCAD